MPGTKEEKTDFLFYKALWFKDKGQLVKALFCLGKVLRLDPKNEECLQEMGSLGYLMKRSDIGLNALLGLYNHGLIKPRQLPFYASCWRRMVIQEETTRKILKTFHGRALLADEVGLGKTIGALMVLKEYIQRSMVKSALMLTPTPLVSQWKEEMEVKFGLNFPSTDDPGYRTRNQSFWKEDFILASINLAKSKKNFPIVTQREYDMVIVDEAHHLKNRNTLNWKLINALKKRFLLLLTATPVENNLMELYNLVTLLKPGQLKTASAFREKFMTCGDPTDPRNRSLTKRCFNI